MKREGLIILFFAVIASIIILPFSSAALTCSADPNPASINSPIVVSATGGAGTYSWTTTGASPASGSGPAIQIQYSTPGQKTVNVQSSGTAGNCRAAKANNVGSGQVVTWTNCDGTAGYWANAGGPGETATNKDLGCVRDGSASIEESTSNIVYTGSSCGSYSASTPQTATCTVNVDATSCSNDDQIIMRLFTESNTHVYQWNSGAGTIKVCYDDLFAGIYTGGNIHSCVATEPKNTVLRTFGDGASNTHAERPDGTTTGYFPLCYGDLRCEYKTATQPCSSDQAAVLYFSSPTGTNSHVSKNYFAGASKICCNSPSNPPRQGGCRTPTQTILTLYENSNAHASLFNLINKDANAKVSICYDDIYGAPFQGFTGGNPWECKSNNQNEVVRLDVVKNAHAAETGRGKTPAQTKYDNPVCYGDLQCTVKSSTQSCSVNEALIAFMSGSDNAHLSKIPIPGWLKICCHSPENPNPEKGVCGDGTVQTARNEVCELPGDSCIATSGEAGTCSSDCLQCTVATIVTPDIVTAEWRDSSNTRLLGADWDQEIELFGATANYAPGTTIDLEVYSIDDVSNNLPSPSAPSSSAVTADQKLSIKVNTAGESLKVADIIPSDSQYEDKFVFKWTYTDPTDPTITDEKASNQFELNRATIVREVDLCQNVIPVSLQGSDSPDETTLNSLRDDCNTATPREGRVLQGATCDSAGKSISCYWDETETNWEERCKAQEIAVDAFGREIDKCLFTIQYSSECNAETGFKSATIDATRVLPLGSPTECVNQVTACEDQSLYNLPCERAFLSLPFFTAWQIAGAAIVLFLIYVVLIKTGIIGKKESNKKKIRRKK
ncbi:MAG: hypothetical protein Q8Q31_02635 [Nanoarchaeota archaeon]|nr:hypothetical protein [Nanoarchaeota archaeon]